MLSRRSRRRTPEARPQIIPSGQAERARRMEMAEISKEMLNKMYNELNGPNEDYFTKEEIEKMVDRHWANTQVKQALIDGLKLREVSN